MKMTPGGRFVVELCAGGFRGVGVMLAWTAAQEVALMFGVKE